MISSEDYELRDLTLFIMLKRSFINIAEDDDYKPTLTNIAARTNGNKASRQAFRLNEKCPFVDTQRCLLRRSISPKNL